MNRYAGQFISEREQNDGVILRLHAGSLLGNMIS